MKIPITEQRNTPEIINLFNVANVACVLMKKYIDTLQYLFKKNVISQIFVNCIGN